jgi:predicted flavoprotein YhiN
MAAEVLAAADLSVHVYEAMPSVGRKFLMAGKGGLNLTHAEPFDLFLSRYGPRRDQLERIVTAFGPDDIRTWAEGLGIATFVGSSDRVFPTDFKAAPLLRAWLRRLRGADVQIHVRHRWQGWTPDGALCFETPNGLVGFPADSVVLALGGASWPRLGSDGRWTDLLSRRGVAVSPFRPANMGFRLPWSEVMRSRFEGEPLKRIALTFQGVTVRGEAIVTADGIEGGDLPREALAKRLDAPRKGQSASTFLRKSAGLSPVGIALLREASPVLPTEPGALADLVKAVPLRLTGTQSLARAISSAGGIPFGELDEHLMLRRLPGVFAAGEMLDWEAPTGGYLLQACFATGLAAGEGALSWLRRLRG